MTLESPLELLGVICFGYVMLRNVWFNYRNFSYRLLLLKGDFLVARYYLISSSPKGSILIRKYICQSAKRFNPFHVSKLVNL